MRHLNRLKRLGDRADLVQLDEDGVRCAELNALLQTLRVRDEEIIADELNLVAECLRHRLPAVPVLLVETVLDRVDRELVDERLPMLDEIIRRELLAGLRLMIEPLALLLVLPLGGSRIHRENEILSGLVAGILNRLQDVLDRVLIGVEIRSEAALVADRRRLAFLLEECLQRMEHLSRPAQCLTERRCACRHNHELLRIDGVRRMCAAVQDVHHRNGQDIRLQTAEETVERNILGLCRRIRCCNRNSKNRVCTEFRLVFRAIHVEHRLIDDIDVARLETEECRSDLLVDVVHRLRDTLAAELRLVAVTQLQCLELTRGCTRGRSAAANRAVLENDLCLDRRIAARIDDLTTDDLSDS